MTAPEIKPCPLCRHTPSAREIGVVSDAQWAIDCECGVGLAAQTEAEAIAIWNTRAPDPMLAEALEALRYYAHTFCEGFCADLPQAGTYHESMDDHCSGCKARAALAKTTAAIHKSLKEAINGSA